MLIGVRAEGQAGLVDKSSGISSPSDDRVEADDLHSVLRNPSVIFIPHACHSA